MDIKLKFRNFFLNIRKQNIRTIQAKERPGWDLGPDNSLDYIM